MGQCNTCSVVMMNDVLLFVNGITAAVSVILNATLLISCASTRTTRLPGFQLIGNLAARDILTAFVAVAAIIVSDEKIFCLVTAFAENCFRLVFALTVLFF